MGSSDDGLRDGRLEKAGENATIVRAHDDEVCLEAVGSTADRGGRVSFLVKKRRRGDPGH